MKILSLFVLLVCLAGCYAREAEHTGLEGKELPNLIMLMPDSTTNLNTSNISSGKPFVIFDFGPYCPYSRAQMESFIKDIDKFKDIHIYAITNAPFSEMKDFQKHYQLEKYPNITVAWDDKHAVADYFEIVGVPFIAIYNKDKKLNKAFVGNVDVRQIIDIAED